MRITGAHVAIAIWLISLVASIVIVAVLIFKQRARGIPTSLLMIFGTLLMAAFVSAIIGLYDLNGYFFTLQFAASIAIGGGGLALFGWGTWRAVHCLKSDPRTQAKSIPTGRQATPPRHSTNNHHVITKAEQENERRSKHQTTT